MSVREQYSVAIIEPSRIVSEGLSAILHDSDFRVVRQFETVDDFNQWEAALPEEKRVDIVLLNPVLLGTHPSQPLNGLFPDACSSLVAMLYSYIPPELLLEFDATIGIDDAPTTIIEKLRDAVATAAKRLDCQNIDKQELTKREKEILAYVVKGLTNKEIGEKLCISIHTVISHRKNIVHKTGIKTVSGLLMYALFNDIVTADEIPQE
ncbi:MAG TPA: response regulator transcription factor [Bacteroidales bacterium]|jgi:DNA-binding CsgD family transcriptional regulator|nr:response regulator transcription factor [Bacteroidales bacterium]